MSAYAPPPPGSRQRRDRTFPILVALAILAIVAVVAILVLKKDDKKTSSSAGGALGSAPYDATVYIESNNFAEGTNSVLAFRAYQGKLTPLRIAEYPTGGTGSHDLDLRGVLDADQEIVVNDDRTLMFAVNAGSDDISVFRIAKDGSLTPVKGSPFPSGGPAPASVGLRGDILVVVNKAQDGSARELDLRKATPNYTTFKVSDDGKLTPTGSSVPLPPRSSPTQAYIAPGGKLVFSSEELGFMRAMQLSPNGTITNAPGSPLALDRDIRRGIEPSGPLWPQGLVAQPDAHILYAGVANASKLAVYSYDDAGRLTYLSSQKVRGAFLPCWAFMNKDLSRLYIGNAGNNTVSVFDIRADPRSPRQLQTLKLSGKGNPWSFHIDPTGKYVFVTNPRDARDVPAGEGNNIHVLAIGPQGLLSEAPGSPVPIPVALGTNPWGMVVLPKE